MARSLLVGSLNLESADAVFEAVGEILAGDVTRVPDGETGDRLGWIAALEPKIAATDGLERTPQTWGETETRHSFSLFGPAPGVRADDITFANLGYADDAIASYARFAAAVERGILADDMRFQVSLPTAYMALMAYIELEHRDALTPAYERALGHEVSRIVDGIPAHRLAIQWDCPCEVGITEQVGPPNTWTLDDVAAELGRMAALLPAEVELGYHLAMAIRPTKPAGMASTGWSPTMRARWSASPMPCSTTSRDPSAGCTCRCRSSAPTMPTSSRSPTCRLPEDTELYLGLVHFEDGVAGTQHRIETASRYAPSFGVAAECGLGRVPRAEVVPTLQIHHDVDVPIRR